MPRVKFDYVVSFSSEDPEHRAANLLASEVSKKKWLCSKGEPSCSVVLQLPRAVEISTVHIGAYHAALVEVLVGLSERPNDPFQVLVPSSIFVPPAQSRRDEGVARVRSFTGEELAADSRGKRYDRVRIVCSQPYNKHCQYGLSFIHIHEPETRKDSAPTTPAAPALPSRMFALDTFSSDEEEFRPGELFAKHKSPKTNDTTGSSSTGAQIRQATSHALKNISDTSTKIIKTPISKPGTSRDKQNDEVSTNRERDDIMYTDDDARPHDKIDRVVNKHNDEKNKNGESNKKTVVEKNKDKRKNDNDKNESLNKHKHADNINDKNNTKNSPRNINKNKQKDSSSNNKGNIGDSSTRKRKRDSFKTDKDIDPSLEVGPVCQDLSQILRGVNLALSGYAGARRAALRDTTLTLGARYSPDWTPQCTHLICAFPNTPKLRTARASGCNVGVAKAEWLDECLRLRRRLPWRWFATDRADYTPPQPLPKEPELDSVQEPGLSDRNTDDEIEDALKLMPNKKARRSSTPDPDVAAKSDSDVSFVKDERFIGQVSLLDSSDDNLTDCEDVPTVEERIDTTKALPHFFEGYTFVITDEVVKNCDRDMLTRYILAFGGLVLPECETDEDIQMDYVICLEESTRDAAGKKGVRVRPSWIWRCAAERRLCSVDGHT